MRKDVCKLLILLIFCSCLNACAVVFQRGRRSDIERIKELESRLNDLESTKSLLEEKLKTEIENKQVAISMEERGLVITVLTKVLFDSGKAELKPEFISILDRVGDILIHQVPDKFIEIQGHTDNQPIKYSGWKSNWELSCARALSVMHYLIEERSLEPERVNVACFGEYRPVASNETEEGRQKNRRVEIVIFPEEFSKVEATEEGFLEEDIGEEENLK